MSLLHEAFEEFVIINKMYVDDNMGGIEAKWVDGATFKGAMVFNTSPEVTIAQAMGATNLYTLTVTRDLDFDYHMVIRRKADEKIFRITSNSDDNKTPKSAGLNMKQYQAEEWRLTTDEQD